MVSTSGWAMSFLDDYGKLVLRVMLGALLLFHGLHKVLDGIEPIKAMLVSHGIPDALAYGVYLGEIVGPVLILLGMFSRVGAALIAVNMIVAIALTKLGSIFTLAPTGGYALELEMLYLLAAVAVALLGAGRFSLSHSEYLN